MNDAFSRLAAAANEAADDTAPLLPGPHEPVVMLHSSAASGRQWRALLARLGTRRPLLASDLLGHGATPAWPHARPLTLADEFEPLLGWLQAHGGGHVVGHSYGGAVAMALAAARPDLVLSLSLYEPAALHWLAADPGCTSEYEGCAALAAFGRRALRRGRPDLGAARFVDFWAGGPAWATLAPEQRAAVTACMPSVCRQFEALRTARPEREALLRLARPVLVMSGSATVAPARRIAQLLQRALPQAEHVVLPGLGHMGPITHPHVVQRALARHWWSTARPPMALRAA
jgi:pimeloyl-ACP methyl ester carboxylesterase